MTASPARRLARQVVTRVRERSSFAHEALDSALRSSNLTPDDTSLATRLAYGAIQMQGTLDEAIDRYLNGKRIEPRVRDALRVSAYELLFLRTAPRATVHQGVELAREVRPQVAGLANAVLRRLADDAATFPWGDPHTDVGALARAAGHPRWLADMWVSELGIEAASAVMIADDEPAPLYLAANPFAGTAEAAREALRADGALPQPCPLPECVVAGDAAAATRGTALRSGLVVASDAAAQLVSRLVDPRPGELVVEIGSGRGTKTLLLQALAMRTGGPAHIVAIDLHDFKAKLLRERMERFGVPDISTVVGDATDIAAIEGAPAAGTVDSVLVDAPCTGLGTLRRHPEKRWRVDAADIRALAGIGEQLLEQAARLVRPGGFVVYSTCTIADRENAQVVRAFLASGPGSGFVVDDITQDIPAEWRRFVTEEGFFRSLPEPGGPDGHFAVRLRRA